jgi:hypothetical protein
MGKAGEVPIQISGKCLILLTRGRKSHCHFSGSAEIRTVSIGFGWGSSAAARTVTFGQYSKVLAPGFAKNCVPRK